MPNQKKDFVEVINYTTSELVRSVWYRNSTEELIVCLQNGGEYLYKNVPQTVADRFVHEKETYGPGASFGYIFLDYVRGKYKHEQIRKRDG
jgi:hypothetical protein